MTVDGCPAFIASLPVPNVRKISVSLPFRDEAIRLPTEKLEPHWLFATLGHFEHFTHLERVEYTMNPPEKCNTPDCTYVHPGLEKTLRIEIVRARDAHRPELTVIFTRPGVSEYPETLDQMMGAIDDWMGSAEYAVNVEAE